MRASFSKSILCGLIFLAGSAYGETVVKRTVYSVLESSEQFGSPDFANGPQLPILGQSADGKSKLKNVFLELPTKTIALPHRISSRVFREYSIEGNDTRWLSRYLFGDQKITLRDVKITFPSATEKRLAQCIVAEASLREYPLRAIVERTDADVASEASAGSESELRVISCLFIARRMICYARLEGPVLHGASTEEMVEERVRTAIRDAELRSGFRVRKLGVAGGYVAVDVSGRFVFRSGTHLFSE